MGWLSWWFESTHHGYPRKSWEAVGVYSEKSLLAWMALGVRTPEHIAAWRRFASNPKLAAAWQAAGEYSPYTAHKWVKAGFDLSHVQAAHVRGWDLADAIGWRSSGLSVQEIDQWSLVHATPDEALALRRHLDAASVRKWTKQGVTTAEDLLAWGRTGVTPAKAGSWQSAGFTAEEALGWIEAGRDVGAARKAKAAGLDSAVLRALDRTNRPGHEAKAWRDAALHANVAVRWIDAGFQPDEALTWRAAGFTDPLVAGAWSIRDFAPDDARRWAAGGFETVDLAAQWRALGESPDAAIRSLGSPQGATPWVRAGLAPEGAAAWAVLAVPPNLAKSLQGAQVQPGAIGALEWLPTSPISDRKAALTAVLQWCQLGADAGEVEQLRASWTLADASRWTKVLRLAPVPAYRWASSGLALPDCTRWLAGGVAIEDAIAFGHQGIDAEEAIAWRSVGLDSAPAAAGARAYWPVAEARRWVPDIIGDEAEARSLHELLGGDLEAARAFKRRGIDAPADIDRWMTAFPDGGPGPWLEAGFDDVTAASGWQQAGFEAAGAKGWERQGFNVVDAPVWIGLGLDPLGAGEWRSVAGTAHEAQRWREHGILEADDVRSCQGMNLDPHQAQLMVTIGLRPAAVGSLDEGERLAAVRRAVVEHLGYTYGRPPTIELDVAYGADADVPTAVAQAIELAVAVGEPTVRIHHGAPHLSLGAVRALPEARFVRGQGKADLWRAIDNDHLPAGPAAKMDPDGTSTEFTVAVSDPALDQLLATAAWTPT